MRVVRMKANIELDADGKTFAAGLLPDLIAALLGFSGIEMYLRVRTVDDGMRHAVRERLLNDVDY